MGSEEAMVTALAAEEEIEVAEVAAVAEAAAEAQEAEAFARRGYASLAEAFAKMRRA